MILVFSYLLTQSQFIYIYRLIDLDNMNLHIVLQTIKYAILVSESNITITNKFVINKLLKYFHHMKVLMWNKYTLPMLGEKKVKRNKK